MQAILRSYIFFKNVAQNLCRLPPSSLGAEGRSMELATQVWAVVGWCYCETTKATGGSNLHWRVLNKREMLALKSMQYLALGAPSKSSLTA